VLVIDDLLKQTNHMIEDYKPAIEGLAAIVEAEILRADEGLKNIVLCGVASKVSAISFLEGIDLDVMEASEVARIIAAKFPVLYYDALMEDAFLSSVDGLEHRDFFVKAYSTVINAKFKSLSSMISSVKMNKLIVRQYLPRLRSMKTQSLKKDKWGDYDYSGWSEVLNQFSREKAHGAMWEGLFDNLPEPVVQHLEAINQTNTLAKFIGVLYESELSESATPDELPFECETGEDFELKIKSLVEESVDSAIVQLTPRTGDHGADLIISANGVKIAVQAKFYTGSVGNSAVQEIYSAKDFYDADFAVVVTSSNYTAAAVLAAKKLNVLLAHESDIVDVINMLIE
jgi:restriction system protein